MHCLVDDTVAGTHDLGKAEESYGSDHQTG